MADKKTAQIKEKADAPAPVNAQPQASAKDTAQSRAEVFEQVIDKNHQGVLSQAKDDKEKGELEKFYKKYKNLAGEYTNADEESVRDGKPNIRGLNVYIENKLGSAEEAEKPELEGALQYGRKLQTVTPQTEQSRTWGEAAQDNMGSVLAVGGALLGLLLLGGGIEGLLLAGVLAALAFIAAPMVNNFINPQATPTVKTDKDEKNNTKEKEKVASVDMFDVNQDRVVTRKEFENALKKYNTKDTDIFSKDEYAAMAKDDPALKEQFDAVLKKERDTRGLPGEFEALDLGNLYPQMIAGKDKKEVKTTGLSIA